jgi:two-component sensor histidine kinase
MLRKEEIKALEKLLLKSYNIKDRIDIINNLAFLNKDLDIEHSIKLCHQAIDLVESDNISAVSIQKSILTSKAYLCNNYALIKQNRKSLELIKELLPLVENRDEFSEIYTIILIVYGYILYDASNTMEALEYFYKAYDLAAKEKYYEFQAWASDAIANYYVDIKEFKKALIYFNEAIALRPDNIIGMAITYNNIANSYLKSGEYTEAMSFAEKSLKIIPKNSINRLSPNLLDTVGEILFCQKKYMEALHYLKESLKLSKNSKLYDMEIYTLLNLGNTYKAMNDNKALTSFEEALKLSRQLKAKPISYKCLKSLSEYYEYKEDFKTSLKYFKEYNKIKLEVFEAHNDTRIHSLKEIHEVKLLHRHLKEKDTVIKEIHHRVKNNLNIVSSLINFKALEIGNSTDLSDLANQINAIGLVHDKLYKNDEFTDINFKSYSIDLLETILASISGLVVNIHDEIEDLMLPSKLTTTLGLIINETAVNAIKHAFRPNTINIFSIQFIKKEQYTLVLANSSGDTQAASTDTNSNKTENSLGLNLIDALVQQLEGDIIITNTNMFTIKITFPIDQD